MTYEEFEWQLLRLAYEEKVERFQTAFIAYTLGLNHETVKQFLDQGVREGVLDVALSEEGHVEYFIPGVDRDHTMPQPVWKQPSTQEEILPNTPHLIQPYTSNFEELSNTPQREYQVNQGEDGTLSSQGNTSSMSAPTTSRTLIPASPQLRRRSSEGSQALVPYRDLDHHLAEASEEVFCDPSQTVFMRQIRVYCGHSEEQLRENIQQFFESCGYRTIATSHQRLRFERGSVTFILALVPLFVLIIPLFVYLFLYCLGRSTIQQEPVELDIHIRPNHSFEACYDIEITFVGFLCVVLGTEDQRILNQEIDTLREELHLALASP